MCFSPPPLKVHMNNMYAGTMYVCRNHVTKGRITATPFLMLSPSYFYAGTLH